jgi:uncharacterized membrane protein
VEKEDNLPVSPAQEGDDDGSNFEQTTSPAGRPAPLADDSETVQILNGALGLLAVPEIGPETEEEVKTRRELNVAVHRMLILGLILSTTVLCIGLVLSAVNPMPEPSRVTDFRLVFNGLRRGSPASILSLGILLLIATPVLRVLGSLIEFIGKRDWRYALLTSLVLLILGISVYFGKG